jgi:5,10-methylene-tetrahydrofolate dehydrogenase/methenyl tetrahydrofolate cyclohydrolase
VGFSVVNGKVVGDIDKKCYNKASIVVPVPGGIGKLSLVCLLENLKCLNQ